MHAYVKTMQFKYPKKILLFEYQCAIPCIVYKYLPLQAFGLFALLPSFANVRFRVSCFL
jgi:hypothetical protein